MGYPFIKVEWEDTSDNLTQERIKRVKTYFQNKYSTANVRVVPKILSNDSNTKLKSLDVSDNILDYQYQKKLVKEFIEENKIEIKWDLVNRLDDRVNSELDKVSQNKIRFSKWYIKRIEFSNFLSFGDDNFIDFTLLDGISAIESTPKNFGGKTTATIDLLLFLFFNSTTKFKTNIDIFNKFTETDDVSVKGYVTIDGEDYVLTRSITRKKTKAGDYNVKNNLEFAKIEDDGTVINLSGEQRRETENIITSAIGTEEDFLSTILTTGKNLEDLVDSLPTARGRTLSKFLGLEILKDKEDICKDIYAEWSKKLVSNTNNIKDLEAKNIKNLEDIEVSNDEISKLEVLLKENEEKVKSLQLKRDKALGSRNNDIDQELIRTNPASLQIEINTIKAKKEDSQKLADDVLVKEPSEYYLEDEHEKLKKSINDITIEDQITVSNIDRDELLLKQLEEGTICPTCKRALEDVDHSDEINKIKKGIDKLKQNQDKNKKKLEKLVESEKVFITLKKEYDEYEKNKLRKSRYELEVEQKQLEIDAKQLKIDRYEDNRKKLEENQKIDAEITTLKTQIETASADVRLNSTNIEKHKNNISNLNEKITQNNDLIKKIKSEEELIFVFKTYLTIFGKNGISKVIIKNMIPLLNQELHRILLDSCHFTLELNINEKNELEFLMIDNETRVVKTLASGSGFEKTISSLAIRSVLTKVSSLPKPNIVVMDEVFGKIADENLDMIGEFFKKIKNYFEHILVISHNPLIRNWSDNIVMIRKDENVSFIEYVTTKIS